MNKILRSYIIAFYYALTITCKEVRRVNISVIPIET